MAVAATVFDMADAPVPSVTNPLWIISLLLGVCQLTLGAATTITSGWVQALFAVFMVVYTAAVTGGFFYLLHNRAQVFYSPREYRGGATVEQYTQAMAGQRVVASTTEAVLASFERTLNQEKGVDRTQAREIMQSARTEVKRSTITVDLSLISPGLGNVEFPASDNTRVQNLLNAVYFAIERFVPAGSYGVRWTLRRPSDGTVFTDMGLRWAEAMFKEFDDRTLGDLGFMLGDRLEVVPGTASPGG